MMTATWSAPPPPELVAELEGAGDDVKAQEVVRILRRAKEGSCQCHRSKRSGAADRCWGARHAGSQEIKETVQKIPPIAPDRAAAP